MKRPALLRAGPRSPDYMKVLDDDILDCSEAFAINIMNIVARQSGPCWNDNFSICRG